MADEASDTHPKYILGIDRRFRTKAGKPRGETTFYHEGKCAFNKTDAVIPWLIENAPKWGPEDGKWTNLLRWYERTKDLPGAREAYEAEVSPPPVEP